jgi:hypothetical protein
MNRWGIFWKKKPEETNKAETQDVAVAAGATEVSSASKNSQSKTLCTTLVENEAAIIISAPKDRSSPARVAVVHFSPEQLENSKRGRGHNTGSALTRITNSALSDHFEGQSDVQLTIVVSVKASDDFIAEVTKGLTAIVHSGSFATKQLTSNNLDPNKISCEKCESFSSSPSKPFNSKSGLVSSVQSIPYDRQR